LSIIKKKAKAKPQPPVWRSDAPHAVGHPSTADLERLKAAVARVVAEK
jgi:hypothetical protein